MELLTVITMLALLQFFYLGMKVGGARVKFEVKAPATTGHETFERYYRVHYNTLEQLILFIPALWTFGHYVGHFWAAGLGVIYLIGRIVYAVQYIKDPASRGPGMMLSFIPIAILILGSLIGAVMAMLS